MKITTAVHDLDKAIRDAIGHSGLPPVVVRYVLKDIQHEIEGLEQMALHYEAQPEGKEGAPSD